ncbi:MAG: sulfatase [Elusimicrobiales bacterium]
MGHLPARTTGPLIAAALMFAAEPLCAGGRGLILIGWDTLRADHISALGYKRKTTPSLDAFAAGSVVFTKAISPSSWTLPAFMSVFTSLYPSEHGLTNKYRSPSAGGAELEPARLSTRATTMAQVFKANGYRTAAFTGGAGVGGEFGFNRGFDIYADGRTFAGFESAFPMALAWLRANRGSNFFVFIHGYDTHPFRDLKADGNYRFITPEEAAKVPELRKRHEKMRLEQLDGKKPDHTRDDIKLWTDVYDEKILRADALLGNFLAELFAPGGAGNEAVIIILSDHGEELFDHGGVDHGMTLYDEVIRVPLFIRVPGGRASTVTAQVGTLDLLPTVIDLLGLKPPAGLKKRLRGTSLAPQLAGGSMPLDAFSETDYLFHFSKKSLRKEAGLKLINDGFSQKNELYDTAADPSEKADLSERSAANAYLLEMELFNLQDGLTRMP